MHPRKLVVIVFLSLIALYTLFQARFLILGPRLMVTSPLTNAVLDSQVVTVEGNARNVARLTLDDRQILTDTEGHFKEKVVLPRGYSIIDLYAKDRFNRTTESQIPVVIN